ncbi:MAG TPA: serine/threonine-protein kinase [Chloroflexia bacterium]|nr:serine/threonine-protein kinase [Chloroflexia bacterium]
MLTCEECGKLHPAGTTACDVCGAGLAAWPYIANSDLGAELGLDRLPPNSELGRVLAEPLRELTGALCPFCHNTNRPGATFCTHCGHTLVAPAATPAPSADSVGHLPAGTLLSERYRIIRRVAQGGMGAVYEAQDEQAAGSRLAVKEMVHTSIAPEERTQALKDFMREATILATLTHTNLPRFQGIFQEDGKYYLVMEFVQGRTLEQVVTTSRGFLPEGQVLTWAAQLCDALTYLHGQDPPIIYRDMKPGNIMLLDGAERIMLIDFGIARFHRRGRQTDTAAFGTAGYAPPEQYGNGQTDQRSDVYALAATLHHLLTGHDPVQNPFHWRPIRSYNPHVSRPVDQAIMRALELKPELRYQSVDAFAQALGMQRVPVAGPAAPAAALPIPVAAAPVPAPPAPAAPLAADGPQLAVSETMVDLGVAGRAARKGRKLNLLNMGQGQLKGIVHVTQPWLAVSAVQFQGNVGELAVSVRSRGLHFAPLDLPVPHIFRAARAALRRVEWRWALLAWLALAVWGGSRLGVTPVTSLLIGGGLLAGLLGVAQIWLWLVARHVRWLIAAPLVNSGDVIIDSNGGRQQVAVRVLARPSWIRQGVAWLVLSVLLVGELLALAAAGAALALLQVS